MNFKHTFLIAVLLNLLLSSVINAATFRQDSVYSRWVINSRMGDFRNKSETVRFKTPTTSRTNAAWDYVPGLVAKGIIKAWEQYKTKSWSNYFFTGIQDYADNITMSLGASNLDDLNAGKIYFELYRGATEKGQTAKATTYKNNITTCRNTLKNNHNRIGGSSSTVTTTMGKNGFWHKASYVDEMWLDGLYMGSALYAEWQGNFGMELGETDNTASWNDIALQFDTIFKHTWDTAKKLNYHAWSAKPSNDTYWANQTTGTSAEFWGRGMGWFFAALVDALEYMPASHPARARLISYTNQVADGLKARQDATSGCWYQLLQYNSTKTGTLCTQPNYFESSASSMFAYAFLKGIRLGVLDASTYETTAIKAYRGVISTFVTEETGNKIKLIQSCESAGLSDTRKGDANYYLCGSDVTINNNTEGKVLGPFIMASLEYEKLTATKIYFTTQPTDNQTVCQNSSATLGTVVAANATSYQWYSASYKTEVGGTSVGTANGGNTNTYTPPTNTLGTKYYYCVARNSEYTMVSEPVQITVKSGISLVSQSTAAATYSLNATPAALTVTATGASLSYQWYSSTDASTSTSADDVAVGTNSNSYSPSTATTGTKYYYCVITGECQPSIISAISGAITITAPCTAPVFTTQPVDNQTECMGGTLTLGTVVTNLTSTFQWYSNTSKSNSGGTTVGTSNGGNTATFTPPSTSAGTYFYYCVATSAGCTAASNPVQILINPATSITSQSTVAATYSLNATAAALTVTATGVSLSYQWYSSTDASTSTSADDVAVGTNSNSYSPSTATTGTKYYYCVVTGGCAPTSVKSNISGAITVTNIIKILYLTATSSQSANDTKLYPWLAANSNYSVTIKQAATTAPAASTYSNYDLIIINEIIQSTNAEIIALKTVDKPILSLKSFVYSSGSSRWDWGTPDNGKANNGTVTVKQPTHPVFNGVNLSNGGFDLLSGAATKGIQPVDLTNVGGIIVALAPKNASPFNLAVAIHDVPASVRGVVNSKFLLVAICDDSYNKMTNDALKLFDNAINYLVSGTQFVPEFLYVRNSSGSWETSPDNINWSQDVVIPSATTTASLNISSSNKFIISNNTSIDNLTINPSSVLNIVPGGGLTVNTSLTNNGTLNLKSTAAGTGTVIIKGTTNGTGIANVEQYITTGRNWYLSAPVAAATTAALSGMGTISYYNEPTAQWLTPTAGTSLAVAKGYITSATATSGNITFNGSLNAGNKSITLIRTPNVTKSGFNLVGNPYAAYLDWTKVTQANSGIMPTAWLRTKDTFNKYAFATINAANPSQPVIVNKDANTAITKYIPPMQGFWVLVNQGLSTTSMSFNNDMLAHRDVTGNLLKVPEKTKNPIIRLLLTDEFNNSDETVILFAEEAQSHFDKFDSPKMFVNVSDEPEIFTSTSDIITGKYQHLVINGVNANEINTLQIALGLQNGKSGKHTLRISEKSDFGESIKIYLNDRVTGITQELTMFNDYQYSHNIDLNNNRFSVSFTNSSISGINTPDDNPKFNIRKKSDDLISVELSDIINYPVFLKISNLTGQIFRQKLLYERITDIKIPENNGIYLIILQTDKWIKTEKINK